MQFYTHSWKFSLLITERTVITYFARPSCSYSVTDKNTKRAFYGNIYYKIWDPKQCDIKYTLILVAGSTAILAFTDDRKLKLWRLGSFEWRDVNTSSHAFPSIDSKVIKGETPQLMSNIHMCSSKVRQFKGRSYFR